MRSLLTLVVVLLLAGCGFQLRGEADLAPALAKVQLVTSTPDAPLARELGRALTRAGALLVEDGATAGDAATVRIVSAAFNRRPLAVGATGRVQEFEMLLTVVVDALAADGAVLLPPQTVEQRRAYTFDTAQALGTPAEEALVQDELIQAAVASILRRLEAIR